LTLAPDLGHLEIGHLAAFRTRALRRVGRSGCRLDVGQVASHRDGIGALALAGAFLDFGRVLVHRHLSLGVEDPFRHRLGFLVQLHRNADPDAVVADMRGKQPLDLRLQALLALGL
jgi:hypothetical protein